MLPRATVSTERGSMLPLFVGLIAVGIVLALGSAEVCSSFLMRESMQQAADQLALVSKKDAINNRLAAESRLFELTNRFSLENFQISEGETVELQLCSLWQGWFRIPGLDSQQKICVNSAAR